MLFPVHIDFSVLVEMNKEVGHFYISVKYGMNNEDWDEYKFK